MKRGGVLIVTNERDVDADYVVRELDRLRIPVVRLNTERASEWRIDLEPGRRWSMARGSRALDSTECSGVWWRRPEAPAQPEHASSSEWSAITAQWMALLQGMEHVPGPTWVSPPSAIRAAEDKALQLTAAAELGLGVPATTWTNDVRAASGFLDEHGGAGILKSTATAYWEDDATSHFVFAAGVDADDLPPADRLAGAPVVFQQRIGPKRDVRVTVVGDRTFSAVTDDASTAEPDWRLADGPAWTTHDLPPDERRACVALVARLGLRFAGIDLLIDAEGRHWFCELNPNGEWGWLQAGGLEIAHALTRELTR